MREFLYSEISQIEGIPNIPDEPDLAIAAGRHLCENVLEPIQDALGRISIRSAYRSPAVNAKGAANKNQYNCAQNAKNYASHIWDIRDGQYIGATACVVVTSFVTYYERTHDWTAIAWWIHDHIKAYARMQFFPKLAAFNIAWREDPNYPQSIYSYIPNPHTGKSSGYLTKPDMANFTGNHSQYYEPYFQSMAVP